VFEDKLSEEEKIRPFRGFITGGEKKGLWFHRRTTAFREQKIKARGVDRRAMTFTAQRRKRSWLYPSVATAGG